MKSLGVGTALAAALVSAPGVIAQPYCAYYADGTRECGIPALQTCTQSVVGVGGYCGPDETQSIPPNFMQRLAQQSGPAAPVRAGAAAWPAWRTQLAAAAAAGIP